MGDGMEHTGTFAIESQEDDLISNNHQHQANESSSANPPVKYDPVAKFYYPAPYEYEQGHGSGI